VQSQKIDELEKQFKEADAPDSFSALLLSPGASTVLRATMQSLGMPITRTEENESCVRYCYQDSASGKEYAFWTGTADGVEYWYCGISSGSKRIACAVAAAGTFAKKIKKVTWFRGS
jgi:hypothetical protein